MLIVRYFMVIAMLDRDRPRGRLSSRARLPIVRHRYVGNRLQMPQRQQSPILRIRMAAIQNRFEMEMASG
jgi:hypothetical protein